MNTEIDWRNSDGNRKDINTQIWKKTTTQQATGWMEYQQRKLCYLNLDDIRIVNQIPTCNASIIIAIKTEAGNNIHRFT